MKKALPITLVVLAGCAVDLGAGISLTAFSLSSSAVDVDSTSASVTCTMSFSGTEPQDAGCILESPTKARKVSCIDVDGSPWSCDVTFLEDTEAGDWTVEKLFARADDVTKLSTSYAELLAEPEWDTDDLKVTVTSPQQDITGPNISNFTALPASVSAGEDVTCTITAADFESGVKDVGCTFESATDGILSCVASGSTSCVITVPQGAQGGAWAETNHFARDNALNLTRQNGGESFSVDACGPDTPDYVIDAVLGGPVVWSATQVETAAFGTLVADFYALPGVPQDHDGGIGFSVDSSITSWSQLAMAIRFNTSGQIDVADGPNGTYNCDAACPTWTASDLYHFVVTATISPPNSTFHVDYSLCGEALTRLKTDADFRDTATQEPIGYHAGWAQDGDVSVYSMQWTPGAPPAGSIGVDVTSTAPPGACDALTWNVEPGGYSGSGDFGPQAVADNDYTITWNDSDIDCLIPQNTPTAGQETLTVSNDAQTFDLSSFNYTVRTARGATVDVGLDGNFGSAPTAGGAWTASSEPPFGGDYNDTGTGDGSLAATLRDSRQYRVAFTPESGFTTPSDATFTAQATPQVAQGNYVTGAGPDIPSDGDYDHVVQLTGDTSDGAIDTSINALGAGTVLVRPQGATRINVSGTLSPPRDNVTYYNIRNDADITIRTGQVLWDFHGDPLRFSAGGADNWIIRNSFLSGGDGTYAQNFIGNAGSANPAENWLIEGNTFWGYNDTPSQDHSEALYIQCVTNNGTIRNNLFDFNGSTAHWFITWWANNSAPCYSQGLCFEGNTYTNNQNGFFDGQCRDELPGSLLNYIDNETFELGHSCPSAWNRPCP